MDTRRDRQFAVIAALASVLLQGCATQARLTILTDPPGAEITQEDTWSPVGQAPIVASYDKRALVAGARDPSGCFLVKGFKAKWPSGASTASGPIRICGSATGDYDVILRSADPTPVDREHARRLGEQENARKAADEADERRQAASNAALTQMAIQAALIPAIHNLAPRAQRGALIERLEADAATNATLLIDRDGLRESLSNAIPDDAIGAADEQDARILRTCSETDDAEAATRVRAVIEKLLPSMHNKSGEYTVRVLESNQVNAFTTGGRYIYVYTGLLKAVTDDDELAGILGHELAHIDAGHIGRSAGQAGWMGLGALVGYATVDRSDRRKVTEGFQAGRATFSRAYESEADILAAAYAKRAGYNPRGLAAFFDRQAVANLGTQPSPWLSDHPFDSQRRSRVIEVADAIEHDGSPSDPISTTVLQTLAEVEGR